jgi:hypothetical protein
MDNPKPDVHDVLPDETEKGLQHLQKVSHHQPIGNQEKSLIPPSIT